MSKNCSIARHVFNEAIKCNISGEFWRNKNRVSNCSGISNRHSSRVTLSGPFIFGCGSRQISARFRETCFQFRMRTCVCRGAPSAHDAFVAMQRDPTFRAAYRSANGFTRVGAVRRARAHLRANEAAFRCGLGYRPYFKPDVSRIASKSRTRRNVRITVRFLIAVCTL